MGFLPTRLILYPVIQVSVNICDDQNGFLSFELPHEKTCILHYAKIDLSTTDQGLCFHYIDSKINPKI